jgi:RNase H-like domain found in reverse transcriptase
MHIHQRSTSNVSNEVFKKMCEQKLYGNLSKCMFMQEELDYLGHVIWRERISVDLSKIEAVKDWATPQDLKQLRSFLGLCNYFRRFVRNYSTIASPLSDFAKKAIPFKWGESQDKEFEELKDKLMTAPILTSADMSQPFKIQTDGLKLVLVLYCNNVTKMGFLDPSLTCRTG